MSKNNKTLIISAVCLVVVIAALIIVVIKVNSDKSDSDIDKTVVVTGDVTPEPASDNFDIAADNTGKTDSNDTNNSDVDKATKTSDQSEENSEPKVTKLAEYKGISLDYCPIEATDEMVDAELQKLKNAYTEIVTLPDRSFEEGDMAIVTFEGKIDGYRPDEFLGICVQDILGALDLPEEFESSIIGRKIGDKFQVSLNFPEDYSLVPEAAGKNVPFDIFLEDGFMFKVPEINDSFISSSTEYKDLKSYREGTKIKLQDDENKVAYDVTMLTLKQKLVDNSEFSDEVENEIKLAYVSTLNDEEQYIVENYYIDADTFYQIEYGMTLEEYQKQLMEDLTLGVKYSYILDEIIAKEGIYEKDITENEFEDAFNKVYIESGSYSSKESVYSEKTEAVINKTVNQQALRDKAEKLVLDNAIINGENKIPWD